MFEDKLTCNSNDRCKISATAQRVLTFKKVSGQASFARRVRLRCIEVSMTAATGFLHHVVLTDPNSIVSATANRFPILPGDSLITIENKIISKIKFYNADTSVDLYIYWDADSDEDITGSNLT